MRCLIAIDVQNGFVSTKTDFVVPEIIKLMEAFSNDITVATQFINTPNSGFTDIMHWGRLKESPEIDLYCGIREHATYVIKKKTYSSCTDEVLRILHDNDITEVYLAGIDTDCCVLTTAISLFEMNIRPIVMANYCASNGGEKSHKAALAVLERTIGKDQICFDLI